MVNLQSTGRLFLPWRITLPFCGWLLLLLITPSAQAQKVESDLLQKPVIPQQHIAQLRAKLIELGFGIRPFDEVAAKVVEHDSPELAFRLLLDGPEVFLGDDHFGYQEHAILLGQLQRVKLVHLAERTGWGPLAQSPTHYVSTAIWKGHTELVEFMLLNWEMKPENEFWLDDAAEAKLPGTVDLLIRLYQDEPWFYERRRLARALSKAVQVDHPEIVSRLLSIGADPNELAPGYWYNPFQIAVKSEQDEVVNLLLQHGAKLDACTAAGLGRLEELKSLLALPVPKHLTTSPAPTPQSWAVSGGEVECLNYLLEQGYDVNVRGRKGWTPLHFAAFRNHPEMVKLLLEQQADPLALAECYFSQSEHLAPIHIAAAKGKVEVVQQFVEYGVSPWLRAKEVRYGKHSIPLSPKDSPAGCSPLTIAQRLKRAEVIQFLLQRALSELEAEPSTLSEENADTAFSVAAAEGEVEICQKFLTAGARLEGGQSITGMNPLESAADAGQVKMVRWLLKAGATARGADDTSGNIALQLAAKAGHLEIVRLLLDAGASIDANNPALLHGLYRKEQNLNRQQLLRAQHRSKRALTLATEAGHVKMVELLLNRGSQPDLERIEAAQKPDENQSKRRWYGRRAETPLEYLLGHHNVHFHQDNRVLTARLAEILIAAGARLDPDKMEEALQVVLLQGDVARLELLERLGLKLAANQQGLLNQAIRNDHRRLAQAFIARGILPVVKRDLNRPHLEQSFEMISPLMLATVIEACPDQMLPLSYQIGLPRKLVEEYSISLLKQGELLRYYGGEPLPRDREWLFTAIRKQDVASLRQLLEHGYDPNPEDPDRYGALRPAVQQGSLEMIQLLIKHGATLDALFDKGSSLLTEIPADNPDTGEIVKLLVKLGANPNYVNKLSNTPLHTAVIDQKYALAKELVRHGARHDVFTAAAIGSAGDLDRLLKAKPALLHETKKQKSHDDALPPLDWALIAGNQETVEFMLRRGAVFRRGPRQFTAVALSGNHELLKWLLKQTDDEPLPAGTLEPALYEAVRTQAAPQIVQTLLDYDADPANHPSLLTMVAQQGSVELLEMLVEAGAKVNELGNPGAAGYQERPAADPFGDGSEKPLISPLRAAVSDSYQGIAGPYDAKQMAELHAARMATAIRLLELGANPTLGSPNIVRDVVRHRNVELLRKLLEAGANPNEPGIYQKTSNTDSPLHCALQYVGNEHYVADALKMIELLLQHGADPEARSGNRSGRTPLDLAKEERSEEAVKLLEAAIEERKKSKN